MILKKVTGSCLFEYISEFDSEEKALSGLDGTFKAVKIIKLKIEKTLILKEKENDGKSNYQDRTPKVERS